MTLHFHVISALYSYQFQFSSFQVNVNFLSLYCLLLLHCTRTASIQWKQQQHEFSWNSCWHSVPFSTSTSTFFEWKHHVIDCVGGGWWFVILYFFTLVVVIEVMLFMMWFLSFAVVSWCRCKSFLLFKEMHLQLEKGFMVLCNHILSVNWLCIGFELWIMGKFWEFRGM